MADRVSGGAAEHPHRHADQSRHCADRRGSLRDDRRQQRHRLLHPRYAAHLPRAGHVCRHFHARTARLRDQFRVPQDRTAFSALARHQRGDLSSGESHCTTLILFYYSPTALLSTTRPSCGRTGPAWRCGWCPLSSVFTSSSARAPPTSATIRGATTATGSASGGSWRYWRKMVSAAPWRSTAKSENIIRASW